MGIKQLLLECMLPAVVVLLIVLKADGQEIVLNSYSVLEDQLPRNIMYKVSLDNYAITDSLTLECRGAFFDKYPLEIDFPDVPFLLNFIQNGLPAKNAFPPKGRMDSYYFIINRNSFEVVSFDSLPGRGIAGIEKISENRISFRWFDEGNHDRPTQEDQIGIGNNRRLRIFSSNDYDWPDFSENDIGEFKSPKPLLSEGDTTIYWDTESSLPNIYLFKHNPSIGIIAQALLGDRTEMNIVVGYSESANNIYCFITPFTMYSYSPPVLSVDTLNMIVLKFDPFTLNQIDSIVIPVEEAYGASEIGTAESLGHYLYYYYFWQDGYEGFDPAWLLIFDTRTNEATWLRVGWR